MHGRLLGLKGEQQSEAGQLVVSRGLTVRETERLVRKLQEQGEKPAKPIAAEQDPNVKRLLNDLTERLGAKVDIKQSRQGQGQASHCLQ